MQSPYLPLNTVRVKRIDYHLIFNIKKLHKVAVSIRKSNINIWKIAVSKTMNY